MTAIKRKISPERRAQIGQEKRARTRAEILNAAFDLVGHEQGRTTRIEDICTHGRISRGTFYNYFSSVDELFEALRYEISHDLNENVRAIIATMQKSTERTSAAIRYYLYRARDDQAWGWAMVNLSAHGPLFGEDTFQYAAHSIEDGIESGEFHLPNASIGRDLVLGTVLASMITLLRNEQPSNHPELVVRQALVGLGVEKALIDRYAERPLPDPTGTILKFDATAPLSPTGAGPDIRKGL